jgi:TM2 domain-containing membrane protein YozV
MKSRGTALLLNFFFGIIGFHNFYLRESGYGLAKLLGSVLFCWTIIVPILIWVWAIIEFFQIMNYSEEQFDSMYNQEKLEEKESKKKMQEMQEMQIEILQKQLEELKSKNAQ